MLKGFSGKLGSQLKFVNVFKENSFNYNFFFFSFLACTTNLRKKTFLKVFATWMTYQERSNKSIKDNNDFFSKGFLYLFLAFENHVRTNYRVFSSKKSKVNW